MGDLLCLLLGVALLAIIARALLSWFPNARDSGFARIVDRVTDPVIVPVRRAVPPIRMGGGALDLSTLIVAVAIGMLRSIVC